MRWKKRLLLVCAVAVAFCIIKSLRDMTLQEGVLLCQVPLEVKENLRQMTKKVHKVLKSLEVTHFLCYGSLWGALRLGQSLPWEDDVEICAVNQEAVYLDEASFLRSFRRHGMDLDYDWSEGVYTVFNNTSKSGRVEIFMFELDSVSNMMRRVGWKRRVLPPDCDSNPVLNCFPQRLINPPLPTASFEGMELPVPREGIEIQKYHFQSDWWKETIPRGC